VDSRIVRRALATLIAALAMSACTGASQTQSALPSASPTFDPSSLLASTPVAKPISCPSVSRYTKILRRNDVPGTDHRLIPGQPNVLVDCLPARRVVIGDGEVVARIVHGLNALKLGKPGAVYNCPADFGPTYGLFFNYPNGDVLFVTVDASGCRFASNGQRFAFTTDSVRRRIEHPRRPPS